VDDEDDEDDEEDEEDDEDTPGFVIHHHQRYPY
jgi:hypothetical protein